MSVSFLFVLRTKLNPLALSLKFIFSRTYLRKGFAYRFAAVRYGFETLLRPLPWRACKAEQIPVQTPDGLDALGGFVLHSWRYPALFVVSADE